MDLTNPEIDFHKLATGFGARATHATVENYQAVLEDALKFNGPTFITIPDDHRYS